MNLELNPNAGQTANGDLTPKRYIYPFACHENERELCRMELRALFGQDPGAFSYIDSPLNIATDRSPFISMRVEMILSAQTLDEIAIQAAGIKLNESTFKVLYLKNGIKRSYEEQRQLERAVGANIRGTAEMRRPDITFGLLSHERGWMLGICHPADQTWQQHKHKPQNYSTGLTAMMARALANIAVPEPRGVRAIDPCCGMGNVLIEALSMGIDIVGRDINPLAVRGARANLRHFGYDEAALVAIGDINEIEVHFDAAVVDMPYNLCSVLPAAERSRMLESIRRISARAAIVSTEPLELEIEAAGLKIIDVCSVSKGAFVRHVWLCER